MSCLNISAPAASSTWNSFLRMCLDLIVLNFLNLYLNPLKSLLKSQLFNEAFPDHPTKNKISHTAHTLSPLLPYFIPGLLQYDTTHTHAWVLQFFFICLSPLEPKLLSTQTRISMLTAICWAPGKVHNPYEALNKYFLNKQTLEDLYLEKNY